MDRRSHKIACVLIILLCLCSAAQAKVLGAIVPHHLVASSMISAVFEGLKNENYETIILLGPNHRNAGKHLISTSIEDWYIANATMKADINLVKTIATLDSVGIDKSYIKQEHSIFSILPFINKYFPKAKIVPLTFKFYVTEQQAREAGERLAQIADDKTLVIASVDFSHKATAQKALENDRQSIKVISDLDLDKIYDLEVDSRPSLYCLLAYLKKRNAKYSIFLKNANASDFISYADPDDLTSYITFYFEDEDKLVTILATGDVMLGRAVNLRMRRLSDYSYPFREMAGRLREADISFINLEGPMVLNAELTNEGYKISASEKSVAGLKFAGIDVANLANNHILDNGREGLAYTKKVLLENGIKYCGPDETAAEVIKGTKFAFLGFNFLAPGSRIDQAVSKVAAAKDSADVVVVAVHSGDEYTYYPNLRQRKIARQLVAAGADLIIGNHPHYVQGIEDYQGKLITYSHGNFIFDQIWSKETQVGVVGEYTFYKNALVDVSFLPIEINNLCQPELADKETAKQVLQHMEDSTKWLRSTSTSANRHIVDQESRRPNIFNKLEIRANRLNLFQHLN